MIHYYDLGVYTGSEIDAFIKIMNDLNKEYIVHGFEAHPEFAKKLRVKYNDNPNVHIHEKLIGRVNGRGRLYISTVEQGHSMYASKNNATSKFVEVDSVKLTDFVGTEFKDQINIIRFNIEGAEWDLLQDFLLKEYQKYVNIWLGAEVGADIRKCGEIAHLYNDYIDLLKNNKIKIHQFCGDTPKKNVDLKSLISRL